MTHLENLCNAELDRRREAREDAQRYHAFKQAGAIQPGVLEHLAIRIGRVVRGLGLALESLNTPIAAKER
jgi:hypothetical protein